MEGGIEMTSSPVSQGGYLSNSNGYTHAKQNINTNNESLYTMV